MIEESFEPSRTNRNSLRKQRDGRVMLDKYRREEEITVSNISVRKRERGYHSRNIKSRLSEHTTFDPQPPILSSSYRNTVHIS